MRHLGGNMTGKAASLGGWITMGDATMHKGDLLDVLIRKVAGNTMVKVAT
jgi:hypothetical protein